MSKPKMVRLGLFREDPDNVSEATEEEINRLAGKLKRVPLGLTAMRIAYVTDDPAGGKMVISGNKRLRVLKQAYGEDGEVPAEWFADVTAMSAAERHEFRLNANVSDGHWNIDKLLAQYGKDELTDAGLSDLLESIAETQDEGENGKTDEDAVVEAPKEVKSKSGSVYQLGNHRLMCGDSTNESCVSMVMLSGEYADMVITDPPYNVAYVGKTKDALTIKNDKMEDSNFRSFLVDAFKAADKIMRGGAVFYIWHADSEGFNFRFACFDIGWKIRECLIWVKNTMVLGRQDYQWKHEPCLYGWKEGTHRWYSDRKQTTCLEFDKPAASKDHPTMKPVALFQYQIENSSKVGDVVFDGFGGSGTTIIACEKTGRKARVIELDPKYCDVIRRRWAEFVYGEGCDWESLTPMVMP